MTSSTYNMFIRQHGSAAYVGMVVIVVYRNTMKSCASILQADNLANGTVDEKVHAAHHI